MGDLVFLDSQKKVFASSFKGIYNLGMNLLNSLSYRFRILPYLRKNKVKVCALDYETGEILRKNGIEFVDKKDVSVRIYALEGRKEMERFLKKIAELVEEYDENSVYKKISLWRLTENDISRTFFYTALNCIDAARNEINRNKPKKVVIFNNTKPYQRILKLVAEDAGIKVEDRTSFLNKLSNKLKKFAIRKFAGSNIPGEIMNLEGEEIQIKPGKKRKILISHDVLFLNKIVPWAKAINKNRFEVVCVGTKYKKEELEKHGIKYRDLTQYKNEEIVERIKESKGVFKKSFRKLRKNKEFRKEFNYKGIPLWDVVEDAFIFLHFGRYNELVSYVELMDRMFELEKPDLAVTMDYRTKYGKTLLTVSKLKNIKSALVEHALLIPYPASNLPVADKLAVYGEFSKKNYVKLGVKPQNIVVTGNADREVLKNEKRIKENVCRKMKLKKGKPIIFFTSQAIPQYSIRRQAIETIYSVMPKFPDAQFVVRFHPAEKDKLHEELISKFKVKNVKIENKIPLEDLMVSCDFLITISSSTGAIALGYGKPVIYTNVSKLPMDLYPESNGKSIFLAKSGKEMEEAVEKILKGKVNAEEVKKVGKYYIYEHGEKACKNVARFLEKLA